MENGDAKTSEKPSENAIFEQILATFRGHSARIKRLEEVIAMMNQQNRQFGVALASQQTAIENLAKLAALAAGRPRPEVN
jgi:hypothetical protein